MNSRRLRAICAAGGLADVASLRFETPAHGRIHDVSIVRNGSSAFVLQRVNTAVVTDPDALARVGELALPPSVPGRATPIWPATGTAVLDIDGEAWIRRPYVDGTTPVQPLATGQLRAMARALHDFHRRIDVGAFEACGFDPVNPWSGAAGRSLDRRLADPAFRADAEDRLAVDRLVRARRWLEASSPPTDSTGTGADRAAGVVVLHRDPKPSNFVERRDGSMVLIDFDTVGPGDAAQDLGELLRALVTTDESSDPASMSAIDCRRTVGELASAYPDASIDEHRIRLAACRCCLWQGERYLEDHFSGDVYYRVNRRGDNRRRVLEQLDGFELIADRGPANRPG